MKRKIFSKYEILLWLIILSINLIFYGAMSNIIVQEKNNYKMPFIADYHYEDNTHFSFDTENKPDLWYLSDIIPIGGFKLSIGDIFMFSGILSILILFFVYFNFKYKEIKNGKHRAKN